jgi:hypothetical protein
MYDIEPKIIVRRNLIIFGNRHNEHWDNIWQKILSEYGPTIAISWVLKRELGFTIRNHTQWVSVHTIDSRSGYLEEQIHLDFYNESALSWFQLKYL